jgi:hypothetical protein
MDQREALANAYEDMGRRVNQALRIQNGDAARLQAQLDDVRAFAADAERVCLLYFHVTFAKLKLACMQGRALLTQEDYDTLLKAVTDMVAALEEAVALARDDMEGVPMPLARREARAGAGRPRVHIDKNLLSYACQGMTLKDIGDMVGCSARTVRRRLLEYNLAQPAPPVIQEVVQPDGTMAKEWHPTGPTRFILRDDPERLDGLVREILESFPNYSLEFVRAGLRSEGYHHVARHLIRDSMTRVRGLQARFVNRPIERRVYSVPEVNSLWHHDGNHSKFPGYSFQLSALIMLRQNSSDINS